MSGVSDQTRLYADNFQYQMHGGKLSSFNLNNGTSHSFAFNDRLQLTSQTLSKNSEVIQKFERRRRSRRQRKIEVKTGINKDKFLFIFIDSLAFKKENCSNSNFIMISCCGVSDIVENLKPLKEFSSAVKDLRQIIRKTSAVKRG
jgi:hypothetical protein